MAALNCLHTVLSTLIYISMRCLLLNLIDCYLVLSDLILSYLNPVFVVILCYLDLTYPTLSPFPPTSSPVRSSFVHPPYSSTSILPSTNICHPFTSSSCAHPSFHRPSTSIHVSMHICLSMSSWLVVSMCLSYVISSHFILASLSILSFLF